MLNTHVNLCSNSVNKIYELLTIYLALMVWSIYELFF